MLALDIGGTKLASAVVDSGGRVLAAARVPTPTGPAVDAETIWRMVEALLDQICSDRRTVGGIGVGCGGPMAWPAGRVSPINMPAWRDFPLRDRLRDRYRGLPVRVHNDAICLAVGEHWRGAGRGTNHMLGMVVSTGVGGGLVLGGRLIDGASGNAGHVGHVVVDPNGPPCGCGGQGCLEAIARGPTVADWAREQGWQPTGDASARQVAMDAARGHGAALRALRRAAWALGVAIASATHLLDLEVVAVGGGLSQAGPLLFDPLEETFRQHARMDFARGVRVVPAALGQEAGLVGAAALVLAADRYWSPAD